MRALTCLLLLTALFTFSACNTWNGFKKDLKKGADKTSEALTPDEEKTDD